MSLRKIFIFLIVVCFATTTRAFDKDCYSLLYEDLSQKTVAHIQYLSSIGLGERGQNIKISWFEHECNSLEEVNLTIFENRMTIPQEAIEFDIHAKNTLITTDSSVDHNKTEDLKNILDIRLYPVLRDMIQENNIELFLGTKREMVAYYASCGAIILFEFTIPSSATYYVAQSKAGNLFVIMAGLSSRENLIAQLLTLKLAGISFDSIEIIGDASHFRDLVRNDVARLLRDIPIMQQRTNILIVAGCGLENGVRDIVMQELRIHKDDIRSFKGDVVSLTYLPLKNPINGIQGIISLHLNYGEIMEEVTKLFLEQCACRFVFTGGAAGYIACDERKPAIGTRLSIVKAMNENGEIVLLEDVTCVLNATKSAMHLQIPSIFLETYAWLEKAKVRGSSVDVETFYIMRAIQIFNAEHPHDTIKADCGCFISDYVGEQPLREYSMVYKKYPDVLSAFLQCIMAS